jgi:hypothetical protein
MAPGQELSIPSPRHAWPDPSKQDLGDPQVVKLLREMAIIIAIPIALLIGLNVVATLWDGEAAGFLDQLMIAGVVAFGIVRLFFA